MTKSFTYHDLTWVNMESPTTDEISTLVDSYQLHPLVGEELLGPTRKSKIVVHKDHIYLVLHIPVRVPNGTGKMIKEKEIDFVLGKNFLITSTYEPLSSLQSFAKTFETNSILDKKGIGSHAGVIFYYIMKRLYADMTLDLENIKDALQEAESSIFNGHERKMVEVLSQISREIIDFRQTIRLHKEVLDSFKAVPKGFFDADFGHYVEDMQQTYNSIHDLITANKELLVDLRETNDSLLSTKQNEHMKVFSVLAFVTFPLMVIIGLFTLPTSHTPIIGTPYDWEIITGSVVVLALIMYAYFKERGWL